MLKKNILTVSLLFFSFHDGIIKEVKAKVRISSPNCKETSRKVCKICEILCKMFCNSFCKILCKYYVTKGVAIFAACDRNISMTPVVIQCR